MEKSDYDNCSRSSEFGECELRAGDAHLSESSSKGLDFDEAQAPLALLGELSLPFHVYFHLSSIYSYN